jgi:hypothetical protein
MTMTTTDATVAEQDAREQRDLAARLITEIATKRRLQLAEEEAARKRADEEKARQDRENFELAIFNAFAEALYPELAACLHAVREAGKWEKSLDMREVDFDFPGCLTVTLTLVNNATRSGFGDWRTAEKMTGGVYPTWIVSVPGRKAGFDNFADAILAAVTGE